MAVNLQHVWRTQIPMYMMFNKRFAIESARHLRHGEKSSFGKNDVESTAACSGNGPSTCASLQQTAKKEPLSFWRHNIPAIRHSTC